MNLKYHPETASWTIAVKVLAGSPRTEIVGFEGEWLKMRVAAPPVDGKANRALIGFLAQVLSVPKSSVEIKSGLTSRRKVIQVRSCDPEKLKKLVARRLTNPKVNSDHQ